MNGNIATIKLRPCVRHIRVLYANCTSARGVSLPFWNLGDDSQDSGRRTATSGKSYLLDFCIYGLDMSDYHRWHPNRSGLGILAIDLPLVRTRVPGVHVIRDSGIRRFAEFSQTPRCTQVLHYDHLT